MILLAQNYAFAWTLVILLVLLALLSICIPRPRKRFKRPEHRKVQYRRPALKN